MLSNYNSNPKNKYNSNSKNNSIYSSNRILNSSRNHTRYEQTVRRR